MMKRLLLWGATGYLLGLLFSAPAFPQATVPAGGVMGNSTAAERTARAETVTAIFDRALGSTRGSIIRRGAASWAIVTPGTTGQAWVSNGAGADPAYQLLGIAGGGTNCAAASGTCLDNITGFASTGYMKRTGAGTYTFSATVPYADWPTGTQDTLLGYFGSTTASATAVPNCTTGVLQYATATHTFSCGAAGTGTVTSVTITPGTGITQSGSPNTTNTAITVNVDKATGANLEAGASNKVLTADIIFDAEVTVTFAASQTLDFNTFLNARITMTANITSLTCSNIKASQSGVISFVQSGAGSFTMVAGWCSQFRWAGGARGVLTTGSTTAIDALFYQCISTTICHVSLGKAQAN